MRTIIPRSPFGDVVGSVFAGVLCCGIGIAAAETHLLNPADMLAFAGALVGAGASVLGAFAVADRQRRGEREAALVLLREIATGIRDDMTFLRDLQQCNLYPAMLGITDRELDDRDVGPWPIVLMRLCSVSPKPLNIFQERTLVRAQGQQPL